MMGDKKQIVRVERELMRGVGPMAVLKLLEDREMYGYELVQALARESEGVLTMGEATLYPLLYNLETKKLIRGTWRESQSGRRRKYYSLTKKGEARLASHRMQWERLVEVMRHLGLINPTSGRNEG
jgi:PadR family transcriptional regulator PadR